MDWTRRKKAKHASGKHRDLYVVIGILAGFFFIWGIGRLAGLSSENLTNFYRSSYFTFFCFASTVYNHKVMP